MFEYISEFYGINIKVGMDVIFNGERGVVSQDKGHYIGVNFDKDKPGVISNVHPIDDLLIFTGKTRKVRKMSRSQKNYQEYIRSESGVSFSDWMRF